MLPGYKIEQFTLQPLVIDDLLILQFEGNLMQRQPGATLIRYFDATREHIKEIEYTALDLDFSLLKSLSDELEGFLIQEITHQVESDQFKNGKLFISLDMRIAWQKAFHGKIRSSFAKSALTVVPSLYVIPPKRVDKKVVVLSGLTDEMTEEITSRLLTADTRVLQDNAKDEIERLIKLKVVHGIVMDPIRTKGLNSEDAIPWLKGLKAEIMPHFYVLTKDHVEKPSTELFKQVEFIVNNGSDAYVTEQIYGELVRTAMVSNKQRKYCRIPVDKFLNPVLRLFSTKNNRILNGKIVNISLGGVFAQINRGELQYGLNIRDHYKKMEIIIDRKMIEVQGHLVMQKDNYIGMKITHMSERNRRIIMKYIVEQIKKQFI